MSKPTRTQILYIVLAVSAVVAILFYVFQAPEKRPPPSASGYYSGPMINKRGTGYGDDNGRPVPPPDSGGVAAKGAAASNTLP